MILFAEEGVGMDVQAAIWAFQVLEELTLALRADDIVPIDKLALMASQLQILSLYLTGSCATACAERVETFLTAGNELEFVCGDGDSVLYVNADIEPNHPPVSFAGEGRDVLDRWTVLVEAWNARQKS